MTDDLNAAISDLVAKEVAKISKESNKRIENLEERMAKLESNNAPKNQKDSSNYTILEMHKNKRPPVKIIFPDNSKYNTKTWTQVLKTTVSYLVGSGQFIWSEKYKDFINTTGYDDKKVKTETVSKYFINMSGAANKRCVQVNMLLKDHEIFTKVEYNDNKNIKNLRDMLPIKMILNGKSYNINKWNDIITTTVKHLTNIGIFNLSDKFKKYVNTNSFSKGTYYDTEVEIDSYYVNLHGSAQMHRSRASIILKEHGFDLSSVKLVYVIDGIEQERELNDVPTV